MTRPYSGIAPGGTDGDVSRCRVERDEAAFYKLDVELEKLLTASCTKPDDAQEVSKIFEDDLGVDRLGVGAHLRDGKIHFAFPIVVMAGQK